jgi:hypothetical protein
MSEWGSQAGEWMGGWVSQASEWVSLASEWMGVLASKRMSGSTRPVSGRVGGLVSEWVS